jgi:hypothetical protein
LEAASGVKIIGELPESSLPETWGTIKQATWSEFASGWNSRLTDLHGFVAEKTDGVSLPDVPEMLHSAIQSVGEKNKK